MKISTKGRYALRMMIFLANSNAGQPVSLKTISEHQQISMKYLEQIVTQLCRAALVKSVRGPQGGYVLTRDPEQYTAGEILRVTEGSLAPVACLEDTPNQCARYNKCSTIPFWEGLYRVVNEYVDSITLKELAQKTRDLD